MISEALAQFFTNLKKDNVTFFEENWSTFKDSNEIQENFLSHCLEERSWKCFEFGIKKKLKTIRSIVFANAIRSDNQKILSYIEQNHLFDLQSKKATDLFNIALNMNDIAVINYLMDKVTYSKDVLSFALKSKNKEIVKKLLDKGLTWDENFQEQYDNPLVIALTYYAMDSKDLCQKILENVQDSQKIKTKALDYLQDNEPKYFKIFKIFNL